LVSKAALPEMRAAISVEDTCLEWLSISALAGHGSKQLAMDNDLALAS
jgi:hypothetical protein